MGTTPICTSKEYDVLAKDVGIVNPVSEPEKRLGLIAQNNALSSKIYNLTKQELMSILNNFPIVDKKLKEHTLDEFDLIE